MRETEVFRVLASADRQLLLHELVSTGEKATVEELSRRVAARRHQISSEKISEDKVECAHLRLVHVHLPMLLDLNVIEQDEDTVALTDECKAPLLEAAEVLEEWPPDDLLQHHPS